MCAGDALPSATLVLSVLRRQAWLTGARNELGNLAGKSYPSIYIASGGNSTRTTTANLILNGFNVATVTAANLPAFFIGLTLDAFI